jgi:hypothetical protein
VPHGRQEVRRRCRHRAEKPQVSWCWRVRTQGPSEGLTPELSRRPLLGASSTAVMKYCGRRPVVLVPEREDSTASSSKPGRTDVNIGHQ